MGSHIMKTTIEIADDLLERAQRMARDEHTTLRSLTEEGLRLVLKQRHVGSGASWKWKPVTFKGRGISGEFKQGGWEKIRDEIYGGRGGA